MEILTDLSERQLLILKHIVEEYIDTAEPVGSVHLEKKYPALGVSPATIRNEMVFLAKKGYLSQAHASSGRTPTPAALKLYVQTLMKPKSLSVADTVGIKSKISSGQKEFDKAMRLATKELARRTKSLAVAVDEDENVYSAGVANLLDLPEFYDIDLTRTVLSFIEEFDYLNRIFSLPRDDDQVHILLGRDLGENYLESCGLIFSRFGTAATRHHGSIGIIGPYRCQYPIIIPTVEYFGLVLDELLEKFP